MTRNFTFRTTLAAVAAASFLFACSGTDSSEDAGPDGGTADGGASSSSSSSSSGGTSSSSGGMSSSMASVCTEADGGNPCDPTQYCDSTDGMCKKRCDAASMPTMCDAATQACDTTTGMCIAKCTATSCTGGLVCGPDGLCEAACADATCLTTEELCVASTNDCGTPDDATGACTLANMMAGTIPSRAAMGPIVYDVEAVDGMTADDALCSAISANHKVVFISFSWSDPSGDFPTTNGTLFGAFTAFRLQGTMVDTIAGYSNTAMFDAGQTGSAGRVTVPMCFESRPDDLVISVEDSAGNASNKACVVVPAMM